MGFDALERRRLAAITNHLERLLSSSRANGSRAVLDQLRPLFDKIAAGAVTAPVLRPPGGRHFLESDLPGDPEISRLYAAFCKAVSGGSS